MCEDTFLVFGWLYQIGHKDNGVDKIRVYFLSYEKRCLQGGNLWLS